MKCKSRCVDEHVSVVPCIDGTCAFSTQHYFEY